MDTKLTPEQRDYRIARVLMEELPDDIPNVVIANIMSGIQRILKTNTEELDNTAKQRAFTIGFNRAVYLMSEWIKENHPDYKDTPCPEGGEQ